MMGNFGNFLRGKLEQEALRDPVLSGGLIISKNIQKQWTGFEF
jgi:hypothetical protein